MQHSFHNEVGRLTQKESHYAKRAVHQPWFLFFEDEIHICNLHDTFIELINDVGNRILRQLVWTRTVDQLYRKHL